MNAPYLVHRPGSLSPLLLTCEHATRAMPVRVTGGRAVRELLASHWGWDIGAWELTRDLSRRFRAGAVGGRWSRLWIDLNRRVDDPTLVRREAEGITLPWNADVDAMEIERRVLELHTPYHNEIDRLLLRRIVRGVRPMILAIHSFTPTYEGRERKFDIGVLYEEHRSLAHRMGKSLRRSGLSVRYNEPYSGMAGMMYAVDRHGSHHRLPCLELEVNHALFAKRNAVSRLGRAVEAALAPLLRS